MLEHVHVRRWSEGRSGGLRGFKGQRSPGEDGDVVVMETE